MSITFALCEKKDITTDTNLIGDENFCVRYPYAIAEVISDNSDLQNNSNNASTTVIYPYANAVLNTQLNQLDTNIDQLNTHVNQLIDNFVSDNDDTTDCEPVYLLHVDCDNIYNDHSANSDIDTVDHNVDDIENNIVNLVELSSIFNNNININEMIIEIHRQLCIRYESRKINFKMNMNNKMILECNNLRNEYI
jgi:hypothetical protein